MTKCAGATRLRAALACSINVVASPVLRGMPPLSFLFSTEMQVVTGTAWLIMIIFTHSGPTHQTMSAS